MPPKTSPKPLAGRPTGSKPTAGKTTSNKPVASRPADSRPAGGQRLGGPPIDNEVSALQAQVSRLQDKVRLSEVRDGVEDLQTRVHSLPHRVANLRRGGYAFEKELEDEAVDIVRQWGALQPSLTSQINQQSTGLQAGLRPIENQMSQVVRLKGSPNAARPMLNSVKTAADQLETKAGSAERMLRGMYDSLGSPVSKAERHLFELERLLQQLAEASFTLMPTESGIRAVKAVWYQGRERDEDPDGVLFLTDQRLIFEQKEEVATKKVLFITTEKKKVQEIEWEAPVALVENVTTSKQGMLKNEDHIHVDFASGAPYQKIDLHIWQASEDWVRLINQARSRDFDQSRAIAIDQAAAERVKDAPTECPACGGAITQVILRGMDSITCEYCGHVTRL
jgi:hypothetical protein